MQEDSDARFTGPPSTEERMKQEGAKPKQWYSQKSKLEKRSSLAIRQGTMEAATLAPEG